MQIKEQELNKTIYEFYFCPYKIDDIFSHRKVTHQAIFHFGAADAVSLVCRCVDQDVCAHSLASMYIVHIDIDVYDVLCLRYVLGTFKK